MVVFVDEAGDTGFKLDQGSSSSFILTAVLFYNDNEAASCDQQIKLLRKEQGLPQDFEFHFNETTYRLKSQFFDTITHYEFFYLTYVINKENVQGEKFKFKKFVYKHICNQFF